IVTAVTGGLVDAAPVLAMLSAAGLGMFGIGALRLPGWARLRRRQMEGVAARLALAAPSSPKDELPPGEDPTSPTSE
ncbi:MAG: hypothetical protein OEW56_08120, partial [Gemmatimonadota bacterium]|nr:hypothetical protein [Gemmatimonadota bacterium]